MAGWIKRTVILSVRNTIIVVIKIATITDTITIRVALIWIRRELAVVLIIGHAIVVIITVATIADAVVI